LKERREIAGRQGKRRLMCSYFRISDISGSTTTRQLIGNTRCQPPLRDHLLLVGVMTISENDTDDRANGNARSSLCLDAQRLRKKVELLFSEL
jgi:hypothetical protein